jgi:hypothetical protein
LIVEGRRCCLRISKRKFQLQIDLPVARSISAERSESGEASVPYSVPADNAWIANNAIANE